MHVSHIRTLNMTEYQSLKRKTVFQDRGYSEETIQKIKDGNEIAQI